MAVSEWVQAEIAGVGAAYGLPQHPEAPAAF
jgi:hypothetical protein